MYYPHDAETVESPFAASEPGSPPNWTACPSSAGDARHSSHARSKSTTRSPPTISGKAFWAGRAMDRTGRPAAGLGLANRLRRHRVVSGPRGGRGPLGVIYNLRLRSRRGRRKRSESIDRAVASRPVERDRRQVFTVPVALSLMVFFALCAQCAATLVVISAKPIAGAGPRYLQLHDRAGLLACPGMYQVGRCFSLESCRQEIGAGGTAKSGFRESIKR